MPSQNNCTTVTCNGTSTVTSGLIATSTTTGNSGEWINGTNYIYHSGNIGIGTSSPASTLIIDGNNVNTFYKYLKDGEVRIDPETGDSSIFLSEYNEWVYCDILELKKTKDENGNKKTIVSVSFECSVARLKSKQNKRIVLTEKYKAPSFRITSNCNVGIGTINPTYLLNVPGISNINIDNGYNNIINGNGFSTITASTYDFYTGTNPYNVIIGTDPAYTYNTTTTTGTNNTINLA